MSPSPVIARPAPITTVPCDWSPQQDPHDARLLRVDRGPPGAERERQQDRRQEQRDREHDVRDEQDGKRTGGIAADCRWRAPGLRPAGRPRARPSRPRAERPTTLEAGRLEAARTSASRSTKMPDATQRAAGRSSSRRCRRERRRAARRSGWPARHRTAPRRSGGSRRAHGSGARARLRRALAIVASMAIGSMSTPSARVAPEPHRGDRQDPRAAADVEHAARPAARRSASGLERREAQPGRRVEPGPEGHPGIERDDDVVGRARDAAASVGRITSRRPTRSTGKCAFQASAQSASSTRRVRSSPIGRRPNAWRWPSASATSAAAGSAAARSRAGT